MISPSPHQSPRDRAAAEFRLTPAEIRRNHYGQLKATVGRPRGSRDEERRRRRMRLAKQVASGILPGAVAKDNGAKLWLVYFACREFGVSTPAKAKSRRCDGVPVWGAEPGQQWNSIDEAAEAIGKPPSTVKARLQKGAPVADVQLTREPPAWVEEEAIRREAERRAAFVVRPGRGGAAGPPDLAGFVRRHGGNEGQWARAAVA